MKWNKLILVIMVLLSQNLYKANAAKVPKDVSLADKQILTRGNGTEIESLDPHKVSGVPESNVIRDLFEGLVNQDENGTTVPGVATSWETKDNKIWTFYLRKDAKWSNGDPVTANDFVYSWKRLVDPKTASPYSSYAEMATVKNAKEIINGEKGVESLGVKAIDDYTIQFDLESNLPYFYKMLVHTSVKAVPEKVIKKYGDSWIRKENIVTNGAYKLSDWVVNERIDLIRNDEYWDNKNTIIDKVTFLPIESLTAEMNRFLSGEIDMTYEIPGEHFKKLQKTQKDALKITPYLCSYYYEFNTEVAPFNDSNVRKALSYAIDRDILTKAVVGRGETSAYSFTPVKTDGFSLETPEYEKLTQDERNKKAIELLEAAGFNKEKPLEFNLLYNTSENHKKIATAAAAIWKKTLGVKVNLENQEWKTYLDTRRNGDYEAARGAWCGDYNEASTFLATYRTGNTQNYARYTSKRYDDALDKALSAKNDKERNKAYNEAEMILADDVPLAPIYHYVNARLVNPKLHGYPMNNIQDNVYSKDLYFVK